MFHVYMYVRAVTYVTCMHVVQSRLTMPLLGYLMHIPKENFEDLHSYKLKILV